MNAPWPIDDNSIDCCVTSPPYWGLRDYGNTDQLGLENTPEEYVEHLVAVFNEVRRILKPEGTLWLNLGDSYNSGSSGGLGGSTLQGGQNNQAVSNRAGKKLLAGLKPKDLVGIPWMVAFALRSAGWYLRQDIIWNKPNPMPESVTDRCTKAHEYIFMLTKSSKYYYDHLAIKTPPAESSLTRWEKDIDGQSGSTRVPGKTNGTMKAVGGPVKSLPEGQQNIRKARDKQRGHGRRHTGFNDRWDNMTTSEQMSMGANKRSVWTVPTKPFKEAHFATFPPELIRPCILAGCPAGGIVFDPFMGAGTTALVAANNGRNYLGLELNQKYIDIAEKRLKDSLGLFYQQ